MKPEPFIDSEREDKWSASSAERVHYCAGSVALINSLPPEARNTSSEVAESGSRIHSALETGDDSQLDMSEGEIKERLAALEKQVASEWLEGKLEPHTTYQPIVRREERMWILNATLEKVTSAKLDVAYVLAQHGLVLDYKSGFKATTPAQRNLQAKVQAVALWQEFGISRIRVAIAQHRFSSMLTQADYTEEDLQRAYQEILFDDWRSKQADAPRVPGNWCQYCPAKAWCGEFAAYSLIPSRRLVGSPNKELMAAYVEALSPADLAFIEKRRRMAEVLFSAVKSRLKSLPADQLASVGFELGEGRNQLKVTDFNGLTEHLYQLLDRGIITAEQFAAAFEFKIGGIEEAAIAHIVANAKSKNVKISQDTAKQQFRDALRPYVSFDDPKNRTEKILKERTTP